MVSLLCCPDSAREDWWWVEGRCWPSLLQRLWQLVVANKDVSLVVVMAAVEAVMVVAFVFEVGFQPGCGRK